METTMTRGIVQFPHPALTTPAVEIETINQEVLELAGYMYAAMKHYGGIGLAAPQLGVSKRLIVGEGPGWRFALVNPVVRKASEQTRRTLEGCLSFAGQDRVMVRRPKFITVTGLDLKGRPFKMKAHDLLACCLQHEIDHLNGITLDHWKNHQPTIAETMGGTPH